MNPFMYIIVADDEEIIGVFETLNEARDCISERVEEGNDIEGWRLFEARNIAFRVEVVVETTTRTNVDTDLDHGSKT